MHPSALTDPAQPRLSPLASLRDCAPQLAHHALKVVLFCAVIGLALWWFRQDVGLDVQLVYSLATGMATWALIDLGRFFIDTDSPYRFPRGWRAVALIVIGIALGHLAGTLLGDVYSGKSTWAQFYDKPRMLVNFALISLAAGSAISYFFYAAGKSHYLRSALEASQRQAAQAQLKLLQSQLEPHMLFNTLANLRALIGTDPARATHMLDRLNDYLRSTLSSSRATVHPLRVEFDRLRDYLELMQIRMGPRLHYTLDFPAGLAETPVPPLLLQSLVENAIRHGLEPQVAGGAVTVRASCQAGQLLLEVQDTGVGFAPQAHGKEGNGIALVRERLQQAYGPLATITLIANYSIDTPANPEFIHANQGPGCLVRISLPLADTAPIPAPIPEPTPAPTPGLTPQPPLAAKPAAAHHG